MLLGHGCPAEIHNLKWIMDHGLRGYSGYETSRNLVPELKVPQPRDSVCDWGSKQT